VSLRIAWGCVSRHSKRCGDVRVERRGGLPGSAKGCPRWSALTYEKVATIKLEDVTQMAREPVDSLRLHGSLRSSSVEGRVGRLPAREACRCGRESRLLWSSEQGCAVGR